MAAIMLGVVLGRLISMKYCVLSVVERIPGLMTGSDVMFRTPVRGRL